MVDIMADEIEINIEEGRWRMFNTKGANSLTPFFQTLRGERLLHYSPAFGQIRGLPGDRLATDYVEAVVVGFDERNNRWSLGVMAASRENEKPKFVELVHWPSRSDQQFAIDSHTAGRVLAEYISCPLKLFGVKKTAQVAGGYNPRATVTGPLVPHQREDVDMFQVKFKARESVLPLELGDWWLGSSGKNVLTMRLPRDLVRDKDKGEMPAYNQCVIDGNAQVVRLVPPTGLLGSFFGPAGRQVKFTDIRNVEVRHTISNESRIEKGDDGLDLDITVTTHDYAVYLTLNDESLLLIRMSHSNSSDMRRRRLKIGGNTATDHATAEIDMLYFKKLQRDQAKHDKIVVFTDAATYNIASVLERPVVRTQIGDDVY